MVRTRRERVVRFVTVVLGAIATGAALALAIYLAPHIWDFLPPMRVSDRYDPPVLAGQMLDQGCSGGVYARKGTLIVLTSTSHCTNEGDLAAAKGSYIGTWGPKAKLADCAVPDHECMASDMRLIYLVPDQIPWGHLNVIDLSAGGYRVLPESEVPPTCAEIPRGARVEMSGRERYRTGTVLEIGDYLHPPELDGYYFPCIVATDIRGFAGDSGSVVLVDGHPAGASARAFGDLVAFTLLGDGLAALGLELCTTPDCGLTPDTATNEPLASPPATPSP